MSKKKEKFLKDCKRLGLRAIADFKNEYGEEYCIYRSSFIKDVNFITGDELDWEIGWQLSNDILFFCQFL